MIDIPVRVKNLVKKWETRNPFLLCKFLKIDILYCELGNIKGYYKKSLGKKIIVLDTNLDEFSKKVVLSHELGHALLHSSKYVNYMKDYQLLPKTSILEYEANKFAAELLIDKDMQEYYYDNCMLDNRILNELENLKYDRKGERYGN